MGEFVEHVEHPILASLVGAVLCLKTYLKSDHFNGGGSPGNLKLF
jgi:hypothetical protein